jgi:hypothetical protein
LTAAGFGTGTWTNTALGTLTVVSIASNPTILNTAPAMPSTTPVRIALLTGVATPSGAPTYSGYTWLDPDVAYPSYKTWVMRVVWKAAPDECWVAGDSMRAMLHDYTHSWQVGPTADIPAVNDTWYATDIPLLLQSEGGLLYPGEFVFAEIQADTCLFPTVGEVTIIGTP